MGVPFSISDVGDINVSTVVGCVERAVAIGVGRGGIGETVASCERNPHDVRKIMRMKLRAK
jgi:hypothetical protein